LLVLRDDRAELRERREDRERVEEERIELAERQLAGVEQPEREKEDARARAVDDRPLQEAVVAEELHFLQLELEDAGVHAIEAVDLLLFESKGLDQLDVAQRLGRRSGELRRLRHDDALLCFDAAADEEHQRAQRWREEQVDEADRPV